jgi:hypothetical protein
MNGGENMRKRIMSLVMALMLIACFCTANVQAANNYVTLPGSQIDWQREEYSPVIGDSGFSPYPLKVFATFKSDTKELVSFYAEDVGTTKFTLTFKSRNNDKLQTCIWYKYTARTPRGSYATGYVYIAYKI